MEGGGGEVGRGNGGTLKTQANGLKEMFTIIK